MDIEKQTNLIPILDRKMVDGIIAFYEVLSTEWKESRGECSEVSEQVAKEFGLQNVEGKFRLDAPLDKEKGILEEPHAWCIDGGQKIVDLTAEQFNKGLNNPIPKGVMIVGPDENLYKRYMPEKVLQNFVKS